MRTSPVIRLIGILAVAAVLRPPIAGVGPLIPTVAADLALSPNLTSIFISIPVLCFGFGAFVAPRIISNVGINHTVLLVVIGIAGGILLRITGSVAALLIGTTLVGFAIAIGNAVLPSIMKQDYGNRVAKMTGAYTTVLTGAAALSALVAVPLAGQHGTNWKASFAVWAGLAALAAVIWLPQSLGREAHGPMPVLRTVWKQPGAWTLSLFMGLQSVNFYVILEWLPSLLQAHGHSPSGAGALLSWSSAVAIPMGLLLQPMSARLRSIRGLTVLVSMVAAAGVLGLAASPNHGVIIWLTMIGMGQGFAFPLALSLIAMRGADRDVTTGLSAMTQGIGYLIAALGTYLIGAIHFAVGNWAVPMYVLSGVALAQALAGWFGGNPTPIHGDRSAPATEELHAER